MKKRQREADLAGAAAALRQLEQTCEIAGEMQGTRDVPASATVRIVPKESQRESKRRRLQPKHSRSAADSQAHQQHTDTEPGTGPSAQMGRNPPPPPPPFSLGGPTLPLLWLMLTLKQLQLNNALCGGLGRNYSLYNARSTR